ncbi:hypothetical protein ACEXQE_10200 [Herbiconiux sp. P17]|uniref:hypothetical protein n=1 Tax=Herbiconiux wuyangfengii TaxID=3342794 RepID=UPI0035B7B55D
MPSTTLDPAPSGSSPLVNASPQARGSTKPFLILSAIIRNAVRRGVEDVLYKKGKDGLWSANPWVISIAKEITAETRKTDA